MGDLIKQSSRKALFRPGLLPARCFCCRVRCEFESTGWTDWSESGESAIAMTKPDVPDRPAPATFHGIEAPTGYRGSGGTA